MVFYMNQSISIMNEKHDSSAKKLKEAKRIKENITVLYRRLKTV